MSINKVQGQSLDRVSINLNNPVFAHGQLYVALSQCTDCRNLQILLPPNSNRRTPNIVYTEVIQWMHRKVLYKKSVRYITYSYDHGSNNQPPCDHRSDDLLFHSLAMTELCVIIYYDRTIRHHTAICHDRTICHHVAICHNRIIRHHLAICHDRTIRHCIAICHDRIIRHLMTIEIWNVVWST